MIIRLIDVFFIQLYNEKLTNKSISEIFLLHTDGVALCYVINIGLKYVYIRSYYHIRINLFAFCPINFPIFN